MPRWHERRTRGRVLLLAASVLIAATSCEIGSATEGDGANPIFGAGIDDELDAMALLDPHVYVKIGNCVASAKFKVYVGDPEWVQTWDEVGQTAVGLRRACEKIAINDPRRLDMIHAEWVAWEAANGAGDVNAGANSG